jgi:hypothetical protein
MMRVRARRVAEVVPQVPLIALPISRRCGKIISVSMRTLSKVVIHEISQ